MKINIILTKLFDRFIPGILSLLILLFAVSCEDDMRNNINQNSGSAVIVRANLQPYKIQGQDAAADGENVINELHACLFEDGLLKEVYENIDLNGGLKIDEPKGRLYMVGNLPGEQPISELRNSGMTEDEWLDVKISHQGGISLDYYSGYIDLSEMSENIIKLKRGVARVDFSINTSMPVSVENIVFRNVADKSYMFQKSSVATPASVTYGDVVVNLEKPISGNTKAVAYLCEQVSDNLMAVLTIKMKNKTMVKEVKFPSILKRNTVYTVNISYSDNATPEVPGVPSEPSEPSNPDVPSKPDVPSEPGSPSEPSEPGEPSEPENPGPVEPEQPEKGIVISVIEWEDGGVVDLLPNVENLFIDINDSKLPADASVSESNRRIVLSYKKTDFLLALECDDELEFIPDPTLPLQVTRMGNSPEHIGENIFAVSKEIWRPGMESVERKLMFHRKGMNENYQTDYITVVMEANPVQLSGSINFNEKNEYNFTEYVENEIAVFSLPADKSLSVKYPADEDNWIKIDEVETSKSLGTYRVLAGWKPNDPKADGRVQSAIIVIENKSDGSDREEYTITRQNWGLPVTYLNGVWWCKYNAMGDSRKFEDQILSANDPAAKAGKTLYEYLGVCSAEEYLNLWKWQYMGDKTQGLEVVDDNGVAKLDGYFNNTVHINKLDPKSIAPKGYELPSMEDYNNVLELIEGDYIWLMWDGAHKTGWNGGTTLQRRQKRRNDVSVGSVALPDLIYIGMYNASVSEYEPLVWYGSSSQWDNSGIKHGHYNNMLFAVSNPETGQGWYFNGSMQGLYATKNGAGANNTRIVRFKKSDVEYIYR